MIKIDAIPLDYEPRRKILPKLSAIPNNPEMTEFESAFLCGAIKKYRPKKILEVGVAAGGTTAVILQALEDIGEPYEMHSTDASATFYTDKTKSTGFIATFAKENNLFTPPPTHTASLRGEHKFYLGKYLPQVIDEIGGNIDFVILDTVHTMPGEGLDFLAMLPYLKSNAVVVLHDVSANHLWTNYGSYHATTVLFSAVTAEKFLNFVPDDGRSRYVYPNIAAFQINGQTAPNIENVFLTMVLRWAYLPSQGEIQLYLKHYQRHYPPELCRIFAEAVKMNLYNLVIASYV